jgi:nucleotide-binding universal stress UspA family protein
MTTTKAAELVPVKNILFPTDFSEPSELALSFAVAVARRHGATVHALHALTPESIAFAPPELANITIEAEDECAKRDIQRVESQLAGVQHTTTLDRGIGVWGSVEAAIKEHAIDLIVLGTHGRTGAQKFLLGSVAEEIFRRSPVPVLTIGPGVHHGAHNAARFHRVLFATDFSPESVCAAPYATSIAQENHARLLLLHAIRRRDQAKDQHQFELSVAEAIHRLYELVPEDAKLDYPPEVAVEYGEPADRIVEVAKQRCADLVVVGVRGAAGRMGAATHLERATAHKVVAHAPCPVVTVRG